MVCKVHLAGRGNSDQRKLQDSGPHFRRDRVNTFSLKLHLLPPGLCLLLITTAVKNLEVCTFKEDERNHIRGLLSNWQTSFRFYAMYFFLSLHNILSLVRILSINLLFHGVSFVTISKPRSFIRECWDLCFGEEIWRLMIPHSPPE